MQEEMPINYTYIIILVSSMLIPFIFTFHKKIQFQEQWSVLFYSILVSSIFFILWDAFYTSKEVWGFNEKYLIGINVFNLPVEEILFFVFIPYSSMFTYFCLKKFGLVFKYFKSKWIPKLLTIFFLSVSVYMYDKLYTAFTFFLLAFVTFYASLIKKVTWLPNFYSMFLVILLPFFIVNGLLTGTGLDEPIVWYNNEENMDIRILTIPVEDIFYGMLLLLLNTMIFEQLRKKNV